MGYVEHSNLDELVGAFPTCGECGSTMVVRDAWAEWSLIQRDWVLKTVFDHFVCDICGKETSPIWKLDKAFRRKRIARLNDAVRKGQGTQATIVITAGIRNHGDGFIQSACDAVDRFNTFTEENDPHGEHDFGSVEIEGEKLFWKIDCFDLPMKAHSPDAANSAVTHRVLTIMLAGEY